MRQHFDGMAGQALRVASTEKGQTDQGSSRLGHAPGIGVLVFDKAPAEYLPPARVRALAAEASLQGARLFLFCADDCDLATETIAARTWLDNDFSRVRIALPAIVLIVTMPRLPQHAAVEQWVKANTIFIDDRGLDKLALAELLDTTTLSSHVIPYRVLPADDLVASLEHWLVSRGAAVVKPTDGKRGSSIHMLLRDDVGRWLVRKDDSVLLFDRAKDAAAHVARRVAGRMRYRQFIVQDYVRTVSRDGRAADIRIHLQRDGSGRWSVTRTYARIGEAGWAVSNVSRGGLQGPPESLLAGRERSADVVQGEMEALALTLAATIDAACERPLSELGIDLAIDERGGIWIIEANARPQTSLHEHDRAVRTVAYALHCLRSARA